MLIITTVTMKITIILIIVLAAVISPAGKNKAKKLVSEAITTVI
jgi:hypothetical protein